MELVTKEIDIAKQSNRLTNGMVCNKRC